MIMERLSLSLCIFFLLNSAIYAQSEDCFKMSNKNGIKTEKYLINKIINNSISINPFNNSTKITEGMSIDADITRGNDDFFVRILLKDKRGKEYVILETYNELFDGDRLSVSDYGEETILLHNVQPDSIKVYVKNAVVNFKNITFAYSDSLQSKETKDELIDKFRTLQAEIKAQRINTYNQAHNKFWIAGATTLSKKSFEKKKRILNMSGDSNTKGFEYYTGGIFEVGNVMSPVRSETPYYINNFDWRYQHGKSDNYWMTSVKDQGDSGFCVFFSIIGCTEALANLYYNTNYNFDLSEMELAWCSGVPSPYLGVTHSENHLPFDYMVNHGVSNESYYPFIDTPYDSCRSENINVNGLVKIAAYYNVSPYENVIKDSLIHCGPLVAGIEANNIWHSMVLVGFGVVQEGDLINQIVNNYCYPLPTIQGGDPRIGRTYWIFKDSYLHDTDNISHNPSDGYVYVIFEDCSQMGDINSIKTPITIPYHTSDNIVCEDADGDGYYFWGIGNKPAHCPLWAPDTPDGDDSDINFGPRNEYGFLQTLPFGITIKASITYSGSVTESRRIGIVNGGTLTITGSTTLTGNAKIRVCENGILIIDGGSLNNAKIDLVPGGKLIIRNNGTINMAYGENFNAPAGALVEIEEGEIVQY